MGNVLNEVRKERERQLGKWGVQNHNMLEWCVILGEEVGEVNRAVYEHHFNKEKGKLEEYREELIQVAAVAVAMVECLDRNK